MLKQLIQLVEVIDRLLVSFVSILPLEKVETDRKENTSEVKR
jgi:hypothetical protein